MWAAGGLLLVDWIILLGLLLGPAVVGLVRALRKEPVEDGDQGTPAKNGVVQYLFANKSMNVLTVGLSLLASNLSGITLLGYPAEVYRYGTQFWCIALGAVLATAVLCVAYLPVLHALQLSSSYEYLELRFDTRVRQFTSLLYTVRLLLYLPLVIYVPALAFNQVSGVSIHLTAPVLGLVCVLYTTMGGLRSVAMTGSLQLLVMLTSTVALLAVGLVDVGGPKEVFRRLSESQRLEILNLDPSPLSRTTFWSTTLGGAFFWLQMLAVQPNSVQRYLSVPTVAAARRSAYLQCGGLVITTTLTCFLGAVVYAKYADCDPLSTKAVHRPDQLVAYMVVETSQRLPGLAGLFLAGLFSAALGNLSAALNTLSGTLYADLVSPRLPERWRSRPGLVMRVLVVAVGSWAAALVLAVERMGGLVQVAMSLGSVTSGTLLGLFTLGMFVPRANALGGLVGAFFSLLGMAWLVGAQQAAIASGRLSWPTKPSSTSGCPANVGPGFNATLGDHLAGLGSSADDAPVFALLRVSYLWLVLIGCFLTVSTGTLASLVLGQAPSLDPGLLVPAVRPGRRGRQSDASSPTAVNVVLESESMVAEDKT